MAARGEEAKLLKATTLWIATFGMLLFSGPVMVAVACFGAYALAGQQLTTAGAYTAMALFNLLRFPLAFLPFLITMLVNANIALKRIQAFMVKPESSAPVGREGMPPGEVEVRPRLRAVAPLPRVERVGGGGLRGMGLAQAAHGRWGHGGKGCG
jgi:ATP-binding cassette subfamily C (CFTR/MRP) protein 1